MEEDIQKQLNEQHELIQKIYISVEKTRKYFMWTLIISVIFFVLPLIGIMLLLPAALSGLTGGLI